MITVKSEVGHGSKIARLTLLHVAVISVVITTGCSSGTPTAGPTTATTTTAAPPTTTVTATPAGCQVNLDNAPVPTTTESFDPVPPVGQISVTLSGIPSGVVKPGSAPVEVDLTICNDSPVSYPKVGVVLVLARCSCAPGGARQTQGTVGRFDPATGNWIESDNASEVQWFTVCVTRSPPSSPTPT